MSDNFLFFSFFLFLNAGKDFSYTVKDFYLTLKRENVVIRKRKTVLDVFEKLLCLAIFVVIKS